MKCQFIHSPLNCKVCRISAKDHVVEEIHAHGEIICPQVSRAFIFPNLQSKILDKEELGYKTQDRMGLIPLSPYPSLGDCLFPVNRKDVIIQQCFGRRGWGVTLEKNFRFSSFEMRVSD